VFHCIAPVVDVEEMLRMIGKKLGHYEITSQLGKGGMGEVYRARDTKLNRDVALKVLPAEFANDPERMGRFKREAQVLASLNHTNIAAIYGLEESGDVHALVMELAEGPTLADRMGNGPVPLDEALLIARQIAKALEAAHEKGIIHRDLKPANIKVTPEGAVKVLDFGLAKALEGETVIAAASQSPTLSLAATKAGVILGTAAYMAPEQARGSVVDKRCDIWSFGVVLFEMLTGKQLFAGETVSDTLAAVLRSEIDWNALPAKTPPIIRSLLHRCLIKERKQRLQAIGEARIVIDEYHANPSGASAQDTRAANDGLKLREMLAWGSAAGLVVALILVLWSPWQTKPSTAEPMRFQINLPEKVRMAPGSSFALSPDGRYLAFAASRPDGVIQLWIRGLNSGESKPLAGAEASHVPPFFWSADSRSIAFDAGGKLKKVDIKGGFPQTICSLPMYAVGGSWNRDGSILFGMISGGLMRVSDTGGSATELTRLNQARRETGHFYPAFLPDGHHYLFYCLSEIMENRGLYVGSLDARPDKQNFKKIMTTTTNPLYVPSQDSSLGQLVFLSEQKLMAQAFDDRRLELVGESVPIADQVGSFSTFPLFSASTNGILAYRDGNIVELGQAMWFDRQGKALGTIGEAGYNYELSLSPDGAHAAITWRKTSTLYSSDVYLFDLLGGANRRFTFGQGSNQFPAWSPDSSRIAFASNREPGAGVHNLYQKQVGSLRTEELLLKSGENTFPTSWSHDGRYLLYFSLDPKTKYDLWVLPMEGDPNPRPFLRTEANEIDGRFSPDARWIAYVSDQSGSNEVYIRGFSPSSAAAASDADSEIQISKGGGTGPRWRGDGKELFYRAPDGKVMAVEMTANAIAISEGMSKALFAVPPDLTIRMTNFSGFLQSWDVGKNGSRFLINVPVAESEPKAFNVILNWKALLKK
jgi:eukaryotic-like serine/threonine-protein kinase